MLLLIDRVLDFFLLNTVEQYNTLQLPPVNHSGFIKKPGEFSHWSCHNNSITNNTTVQCQKKLAIKSITITA